MPLVEQIALDLSKAMKERDEFRTSCLRMAKAALKNEQVARGHELKDEEAQAVLQSLIRKGRDAANEFRHANRESMALKEEREVEVFRGYLPEQLSAEEVVKVLKEVITELSAEGPKDLGRVMKAAMPRLAGKAQGKEVKEIAGELLSSNAKS